MGTLEVPAESVALTARDARREAQQVAGDAYDVRVFEPSPPAVDDGQWYADDPPSAAGAAAGRSLLSPVAGAGQTWREWLRHRPDAETWAADRWLAGYRALPAPPPGLAATRLALHRLAAYVLSPTRRRANGKLGLRWTLCGFGTPFFGADEQVRVTSTHLVRQRRGDVVAQPVTSLDAAAAFALGGAPDVAAAEEFDVPPPGDTGADLDYEPATAAFLADWFGFATSVLEEVRAEADTRDASRVQLWPEHFDVAFEALPGERRAGFGASPGDDGVPDPYLYVAPWHLDALPRSTIWNAVSFGGAVLTLAELADSPDQRARALTFFRSCRAALWA